jgi:tetratricopeptide (TPR) repeat protein
MRADPWALGGITVAWRLRRSKQIIQGVRVNLGKRGLSLTVGGKLGRVTVGPSGTHVGASIPGTGVYMTQKMGSAEDTTAPSDGSHGRSAQLPAQVVSLVTLIRALPPREPGTAGVLVALFGSPKRSALRVIESAEASPSPDKDAAVSAAVAQAPGSWSVEREAGLYFSERGDAAAALHHFAEAANRFPGDRTLYYLMAADAAIDVGNVQYAIGALEPYVSSVDPDGDVGALVLTTLASAYLRSGDSARSLELLARLPLRRQNLSDALLAALCVRACANRSVGKKAQAKKDIDRVYAHRPDFPMLDSASHEVLGD